MIPTHPAVVWPLQTIWEQTPTMHPSGFQGSSLGSSPRGQLLHTLCVATPPSQLPEGLNPWASWLSARETNCPSFPRTSSILASSQEALQSQVNRRADHHPAVCTLCHMCWSAHLGQGCRSGAHGGRGGPWRTWKDLGVSICPLMWRPASPSSQAPGCSNLLPADSATPQLLSQSPGRQKGQV